MSALFLSGVERIASVFLSALGLVFILGCGGNGVGDGTEGASNGSDLSSGFPTASNLFGQWTFYAYGVDRGCQQGLICKIDEFRFTLSKGELCSDGKYKFSVASNLTALTMPAAQVRIDDWPDCNRLNFHVSSRMLLQDGDVSWDPQTGVLNFSLTTWEKEMCPTQARDTLNNVWWFGMPDGPLWAEGSATVNFVWNPRSKQFDFADGDGLLATTGYVFKYFSGRGQFLVGGVSRYF